MADRVRTFAELTAAMANLKGSPGGGLDSSHIIGVRTTPGYAPSPNSEALGSETGAPPRPRYFSMAIPRGQTVLVAPPTRDNRVLFITAPNVGFTVFVGDDGLTTRNGFALLSGQQEEFPLVGFQGLYAMSNAPVLLRIQVAITTILLAERELRL